MRVEWYGQSAFVLTGTDGTVVAIDPFADTSQLPVAEEPLVIIPATP